MNRAPDGFDPDGDWDAPCTLDIDDDSDDGELDAIIGVDVSLRLLFVAGTGVTVEVKTISATASDAEPWVVDEVGEEIDSEVAGAALVVEGVKGLASSVETGMEGAASEEVSDEDAAMWATCATEEVGLAATASAPAGAGVDFEQEPGQIVVSTGTVE